MISVELKLRLNKSQERELERWLWHLTGVWNWAIRKIELDANDGIYYSSFEFKGLLAFHSPKIGIAGDALSETLKTAYIAWQRCFRKQSRKPKFKGQRNKLNSIPFRQGFRLIDSTHINIYGFGKNIRFYKQDIPTGKIKTGRIIKRASGWHLSLMIESSPNPIPITSDDVIGIDPGYSTTITTSNGEKIDQPKEFKLAHTRLAQAQRSGNKQLSARLAERIKNRRKDNNHKLSRELVSKNRIIFFSKDNIQGIKKRFGKSATDASHFQLRTMLAYKCRTGGRQYVEVNSKHSTMTCSCCLARTGPTGIAGLSVRQWACSSCGTAHDRDINSAVNTLIVGLGMSHGVQKPQIAEFKKGSK